MTSKISVAVLGATLAPSAVACSDDDTTTTSPPPTTTTETSNIRVVHMSPDAPAVDIYAGADIVVSNLAFGESTDFLEVPEGTYDFTVSPAGTSAADGVLSINGVMLEKDKSYSAVAFDNVSNIQAMLLEDSFSGIGSGNIRVRAIHAAPAVGTVDIWNIPASGDATPLFTGVDFGDISEYLEVPADAYTLGFDVDGDATPDLTFDLPELSEGAVANVFATQDSMGNVVVIPHLEDSTTAQIAPTAPIIPAELRVLHLSPDAPAVDIWVNDSQKAVMNLSFGEGTGFLELEPGTYDFDVAPEGTSADMSVLPINGLELMAGTRYTAVAYGQLENIMALPLVDDFENLEDGNIRVRAIHAATGVEQVDIWNITDINNPSPLYVDVDFAAVADYVDIPEGAYALGFDVNDDATPDLTFNLPALSSGEVANIFAVNDGVVHLLAQLKDGTAARIDSNETQ